jgi:hypothetical protein
MNFKDLAKSISEAQLGSARMTDVAADKGVYNVLIGSDDKVSLVSEKKHKVAITNIATLAAMRITDNVEEAVKVTSTREARSNENYSTLQAACNAEGFVLSPDTKFTVVHRLQIIDTEKDEPIFKNELYTGYAAYSKGARKAFAMANGTNDEKAARTLAFTEASDALRASGLKNKNTPKTEENLLLMPVFTITSK